VFNTFRKSKTFQNWMIGIIVALLASYVLYSFGSAPPKARGDVITRFGKAEIKVRDAFIQSDNIRRNFGGQLDDSVFNNFAATQLVTTALLRDGAERLGIAVSDAELRDMVIEIRTLEDGSFIAEENWADYIRRAYQISVDSYEEYLRENALLTDNFNDLFANASYIPENEIRERFISENKKVTLEMLRLSTTAVADQVSLETDEEIEAYWADNKDDFMSGAQRKVDYVTVSWRDFQDQVEVSEEEALAEYESRKETYRIPASVTVQEILVRTGERNDQEAQQLINKVYDEVVNGGMDFMVAQGEYHEGGAKGNQAIQKGMRVAEVEEALFTVPEGEITAPLKSRQGYAIFKKMAETEATVRTFDQVRSSIISSLERSRARELAREKLDTFNEKLGQGTSFADAAAEMGLEVKTSPFFDNNTQAHMGPDLGRLSMIRNAVFALAAEGDRTAILETGINHVICQWSESAEPAPLDWETQRERIKPLATEKAQRQKVIQVLSEIRAAAEAQPELELEELRGEREWLKKDFFTTTPDPIGAQTFGFTIRRQGLDFEEDVYSLEPGQFIEGFETDVETAFVLARVTEKVEPDMSKLEEERFAIIDQIRNDQGDNLLMTYLYKKQQDYDANQKKRNELLAQLSQPQR